MPYNFKIDDIIPILTIGALSIMAIYHIILYLFSKLKIVGSYSLYLLAALGYLILACSTTSEKTFKTPTLMFLISSGIFLLSLLLYLNFLLVVNNLSKQNETRIYKLIKKTYFITPIYFLLRFPYFFLPQQFVAVTKACGFIMDAYLFFVFGYLVYIIIKNKKRDYNHYIIIGTILLMIFNFFTSITYYTQGYIFGLSHVSFIALGYFSDVIFFSLVVGLYMRENIKDIYLAAAEISKKELAIEIEKKKASDILLTQNFKIENERAKAITQQRILIGRRLHDDLSGSLVALRYLVQDFKKQTSSLHGKEKFKEIELEINNIYKDTRNYSHELTNNIEVAESELSYDISSYLKKLETKFSAVGLLNIHTSYNEDELNRLSTTQTNHIYFLLKECFSNTIKHSNAQNIWINIEFKVNTFTISFIDDGKNTNETNYNNEGVGIMNMRNRINELNGQLEIDNGQEGNKIKASFIF